MAWEPGMKVAHRAQREWGVGVVIQVADDGRRLAVRFAGRDGVTVVSGRDPALQALPPETPIEAVRASGALEQVASSSPGPVSAFALRARVARLEALRRADSLGALLSSRVHVLPHQVGAAGRILQDRIPRFVLADEVGLGKTIEAGLVFSGLRQLGVVERALVAVPEHLAFQWLAELFHKFNALFTLLSPERVEALGGPREALARSPLAIVSFEHLAASPELAQAAAGAAPDLFVVDEAHHLEDDALHAAVEPIARAAFGVLLLTATPVRLDPREYFRLLALVEPVPTTSLDEFLRRVEQHEAFAQVARGLLSGADPADARRRLAELAPDDPAFGADAALGPEALLTHLADRYSLSSRLIRNRRVKVGAFTRRVLHRESADAGGRAQRAAETCASLARAGEKVLAFANDLDVLRATQAALAQLGLEGLLYDDATTIEGRDRLVARFRDPEGPMVLLSGESGGEGRNFQFAAHLVCIDLPESPLALEQRIGRLDRLGQHRPVEIHVVAEPDDAWLLDLYEQVIGIFEEPVGGLDAVLASVPAELEALRARPARARAAFRKSLAARVAEGRRAQHEGYDPLLDIRSAAQPELTALVQSGFTRLGEDVPDALAVDAPGATALGEGLLTLSRWLEEELEDVCAEVGRRVGVDVDTDENVHPFEVAFTLGAHLKIDALPGMSIPEEATTFLGSFWRETAVARDELHWFATGHPLVEALVGLVRDGPAGRATAMRIAGAPRRGGLLLRFHVTWPDPADLAPGARVPSRQAARYLDPAPIAVAADLATGQVLPGLAEAWAGALEDAVDVRVGAPPPAALEAAHGEALGHARGVLARRRDDALARLEAHAQQEEERLVEAAFAGGAPRETVEAALRALRAQVEATRDALRAVDVELDAVAIAVP